MIKYNPKEKKLSNFRYAIKRIKNPRKKNLSFRSILFSGFNKFFFEGRRERKISGSLPPSLYSVRKGKEFSSGRRSRDGCGADLAFDEGRELEEKGRAKRTRIGQKLHNLCGVRNELERDLESVHSRVGTSLSRKQEHGDYPANEWNRVNPFTRVRVCPGSPRIRLKPEPLLREWRCTARAQHRITRRS